MLTRMVAFASQHAEDRVALLNIDDSCDASGAGRGM